MMTVPVQSAHGVGRSAWGASLGGQPGRSAAHTCARWAGCSVVVVWEGRRRRTGADVAPDISPRLPLHAHLHDHLAPRREARAA